MLRATVHARRPPHPRRAAPCTRLVAETRRLHPTRCEHHHSELVRSSSLQTLAAALGLGGACVSTGTVMVTRVCSAWPWPWRRGTVPTAADGCLRMDTGSEACRRMGGVAVLVGTTGSDTW